MLLPIARPPAHASGAAPRGAVAQARTRADRVAGGRHCAHRQRGRWERQRAGRRRRRQQRQQRQLPRQVFNALGAAQRAAHCPTYCPALCHVTHPNPKNQTRAAASGAEKKKGAAPATTRAAGKGRALLRAGAEPRAGPLAEHGEHLPPCARARRREADSALLFRDGREELCGVGASGWGGARKRRATSEHGASVTSAAVHRRQACTAADVRG